jgi:hypothetical protein
MISNNHNVVWHFNFEKDQVVFRDQNRIDVWIDGGWSVDVLIGEQTQSHRDLDIAIPHSDAPRLRALLEARGFKDVPRDELSDYPQAESFYVATGWRLNVATRRGGQHVRYDHEL